MITITIYNYVHLKIMHKKNYIQNVHLYTIVIIYIKYYVKLYTKIKNRNMSAKSL